MLGSSELLEFQILPYMKIKISNYLCVSRMINNFTLISAQLTKVINYKVVNWSLGSYLCEKQLNKYNKIYDKQLKFCHK